MVESQPSKLLVASSSLVSRSEESASRSSRVVGKSRLPLRRFLIFADVAQLVEHFLGKEEVTGSIPVISSTTDRKKFLSAIFINLVFH